MSTIKFVNCQACGDENHDGLTVVHLSSLGSLSICDMCHGRTVEGSLKSAADVLKEISVIAKKSSDNPERRLDDIKKLLEGV